MKSVVLILCVNLMLSSAVAAVSGNAKLMISLDKKQSTQQTTAALIKKLSFEITQNGCSTSSRVLNYIPYSDLPGDPSPYFGVATVLYSWTCKKEARDILRDIHGSDNFTVYPSSKIQPSPAVSGHN